MHALDKRVRCKLQDKEIREIDVFRRRHTYMHVDEHDDDDGASIRFVEASLVDRPTNIL
jgi:hypothetical protein